MLIMRKYIEIREMFFHALYKKDGKLFLEIVGNIPDEEEFMRAID